MMSKKLFQINVCLCSGSHGKIAEDIGCMAIKKGWESYVAYGRNNEAAKKSISHIIRIGSNIGILEHVAETRVFDNHGLSSRLATRRLVNQIQILKPDIMHLHNIHGYYINYPMLFECIKEMHIPTIWTLHDCWPFTGHCFHPTFVPCDRYKKDCGHCTRTWEYPASWFIDRSRNNLIDKKKAFLGVENMEIVAVSDWLGGVVKSSFLNSYPIKIIHNGIDIDKFCHKRDSLEIRKKYCIPKGNIFLGISNVWTRDKGFQDLIELSQLMGNDEFIVMVGVSKSQLQALPSNIIGIPHIENQQDLASLYSVATAIINPTYADNFPTINLEALACGTPVVTYNTGGSPEAITPETGFVVEQGNIKDLLCAAQTIVSNGRDCYIDVCRRRAEDSFDKDKCFEKYFELYNSILNN